MSPEEFDKALDELLNSYAFMNGMQPSSYILYTNDLSQVTSYLLRACHSEMHPRGWGNCVDFAVDNIITAYTTEKVGQDVAVAFFEFLKHGLFRNYAQFIHLEERNDLFYIRITDCDKIPAPVLFNLCICSRTPFEFRKAINNWYNLVFKEGIDPGFAFAVCQWAKANGADKIDEKISEIPSGNGHWPFDNRCSISRLMNGNHFLPDGVKSYKFDSGACTPTNVIWADSSYFNYQKAHDSDLRKLVGLSIREFWNKWREEHEEILQSS